MNLAVEEMFHPPHTVYLHKDILWYMDSTGICDFTPLQLFYSR